MFSRFVVAIGVIAAFLGSAAPSGAAALPEADMEAVLKAAQIDPRRADSAITPGSGDSVRLVEEALSAKGLLDASYVDGHFGTRTIDAYAAYQRSLGYSGLDASGLPGPSSLQRLGEQRYTVINPVSAGSRVGYRGVTMNTRTKAMLLAAEGRMGRQLTITQGSYNTGNAGSAGTHDGGGVLDISVSGMSTSTRTSVVRALREVGFAAWLRTPEQGNWAYHIHAVALADPDQSTQAQHQSGDYYLGLNGLAGRGADDGPAVNPKVTWEEYQR
ncbi:peptidoglycan hydrolase-like protein with peptidoglycan-binding domain [Saccharothrix coeruleofusca]|uniref:peptidoglycan-binding domain-containing protein n=1 Tax=Saccharothrix coeruleofusca TaxID=33919 RepID=UPI001AEA7CAB|nr:peptidoglycan hydrolase-like protein with peptidoglycan-binding domain [Saccharothrix coeruleofusca]